MDSVIKLLAYDGKVNIICSKTTKLVEDVREIHDLTPTTTATMGRFITICGMMGFSEIKENEDNITIQIKGDGPIGNMVCVVTRDNKNVKVKSYMDNPIVELPLKDNGKIDVGGAVGKNGYLNIIKKNNSSERAYNGVIPLVSGEIAEDFTEYFAHSEQKPTVIALGVLVNKEGTLASGGYMINLMPDCGEEEISKIEEALKKAPSISTMISEEKSLLEIAQIITGDENVKIIEENLKIEYECGCSKEKISKSLISIGKEELNRIIEEDGEAEIICHFCNKKYNFTKEELKELLSKV